MACANQTLKHLLDSWQQIGVLLHAGIKTVKVYAEKQTHIPLSIQYHSITPPTLAGVNCTWIQHLLEVCTDFFYQWQRNLPESLNGASLVTLITCLVKWVQPRSQGSKEENVALSQGSKWPDSASSGSQDPKVLKSNFSNSFSCLCSVVSFYVWMPWASSSTSTVPGHNCSSGTQMAATTLATGVYFRVWGYAVLFFTMTATFLLPLCFSV